MYFWWNYPFDVLLRFMRRANLGLRGCAVVLGPLAVCIVWKPTKKGGE
jgi:hypothetical protein